MRQRKVIDAKDLRQCEEGGHESIMDPDECKKAAKTFGKKFYGSRTRMQWPSGCIALGNIAFYNSNYRRVKRDSKSTFAYTHRRKHLHALCYEKNGK